MKAVTIGTRWKFGRSNNLIGRLTRDLPHFADGERVAPRVLGRTRTAAACWRGGRATRRARANHRAIAAGWHYRQAAPCIIRASAPALSPISCYGFQLMPRTAMSSDFPRGTEVKPTYATLVFSEQAQLDGGHMWPTTFAPRHVALRAQPVPPAFSKTCSMMGIKLNEELRKMK